MPERYRLPLILCHLEGLRHEEVAQRLGCPVGTVESRLSRAREQLRTRLTRRGLAPTASALVLALNPPDASAAVALSSMIEPTIRAAVALSSRRIGGLAGIVHALAQWVSRISPTFQVGAVVSTLMVGVGVAAMEFAVFRADGEPPEPHPNAIGASANTPPMDAGSRVKPTSPEVPPVPVVASVIQPPAERPRPDDEPAKPKAEARKPSFQASGKRRIPVETTKAPRSSVVSAPRLSGITIDGQLDDWPAAMPRYPIDKLLDLGPGAQLGTGGLKRADLLTSGDLSAAFSVGYDLKEQRVYLAVIVRDDQLVIGHTSHLDTDALEVFIDGLHSERRLRFYEDFNKLELADVPVQQYVAIAGKGRIYGKRQVTNPILMAGDLRKTRTKMAYNRKGDVTIYEWAIQVFDQYPDKPTKLEPGKRIGFDIAVADKDVPASTERDSKSPQPIAPPGSTGARAGVATRCSMPARSAR